ncbi:MAG TPA: 6-phosphogluconolactonase [Candidatus Binatia bacterium]|jgi:6-phosphogluconolactonase|nr:6-phosphogluconolactonase [Candidatus Binatia bacterium]
MLQFTEREVIICRNVDELNREAAEQFIGLACNAIEQSGRFAVALSGGSTPKGLYASLADPEYRNRLDWSRVHLFWGDERCVPPDHPESNFRMVQEALLSNISLAPENIHRMPGEKTPQDAAADYENELRTFFRSAVNVVPRFDLVLLGLGEDGHTASLFPGSAALDEHDRLVATVYVERLKVHRLTLTLPVINAAAQVTFLIAGQSKSAIVQKLLGVDSGDAELPAGKVRPANGHVTWLVTQDAAAELAPG